MSGDLDLSLWSASPATAEPGSPEGPLEVGESDEAHEATSAALARFLADRLDPELPAPSGKPSPRLEFFHGPSVPGLPDVVQPLDRALRRVESRSVSAPVPATEAHASAIGDVIEDSALTPLRLQPAIEARRSRPGESSTRLHAGYASESSARLGRAAESSARLARDSDARDRSVVEPRRSTSAGSRPYPTMTAATPAPRGARWLLGAAVIAALVLVAAGVTMAIQRRGEERSPIAHGEAPVAAPVVDSAALEVAPDEASALPTSAAAAAPNDASTPGAAPRSASRPVPRVDPITGAEPIVVHCQARDGVAARKAFRALVGAEARTRAIVACRELGVDVTALSEGPTAAEYLEQARAAYAANDLEQAYVLARNSTREHTNTDALELMATIGCDLRQPEKVEYVLGMLLPRDREEIVTYCRGRGVKVK